MFVFWVNLDFDKLMKLINYYRGVVVDRSYQGKGCFGF